MTITSTTSVEKLHICENVIVTFTYWNNLYFWMWCTFANLLTYILRLFKSCFDLINIFGKCALWIFTSVHLIHRCGHICGHICDHICERICESHLSIWDGQICVPHSTTFLNVTKFADLMLLGSTKGLRIPVRGCFERLDIYDV